MASSDNMSQLVPNIATANNKATVTPPTEKDEVSKTEVLGTGPSFEKKLMRKVDMRLIPLLIIMYLNNFVGM
jgi:hypothetical protein